MKKRLYLLLAPALILSSCGVFKSNKMTITIPRDSATEVQVASASGSGPGSTSRPAANAVDDPKIDGEWTVWTVGGKKVTGEERPYITFAVDEHRLYGNNGCNTINADFSTGSDQSITISNLLATMKMCGDAPFEGAINMALDNARYYSVSKKGHEIYLDLLDSNRSVVMVLRRHNMEFLNGAWTPIEINGKENNNDEVRMVIDIPEHKLHGRTGCNLVNGTLLIDPDKTNSIQFQELGSTRMMCERELMATETAMLVALESVEHARRGKNGTVVMTDKDDKTVLVLKSLPLDISE